MCAKTRYPHKLHPAFHGRCQRYPHFQAAYIEDLSACGPRGGLVQCYEIGVGPSTSLRIQGNLFYAVAFAARFWSLFIYRPEQRAKRIAA